MNRPLGLHPAKESAPPHYPTRQDFLAGEERLETHWPNAWKYGNGFLKGLILAAGLNVAGCSSEPVEPPSFTAYEPSCVSRYVPEPSEFPHPVVLEAANWTREIFTGTTFVMLGCEVIMPPSFTPEDEAALEFDLSE